MSGYTPGPWRVDPSYKQDVQAFKGKRAYEIATAIRKGVGLYAGRHVVAAEAFANARLMAAAPEMFEALEMIRDADEDCIKDGLRRPLTDFARARVDAAIAKAEGRE